MTEWVVIVFPWRVSERRPKAFASLIDREERGARDGELTRLRGVRFTHNNHPAFQNI